MTPRTTAVRALTLCALLLTIWAVRPIDASALGGDFEIIATDFSEFPIGTTDFTLADGNLAARFHGDAVATTLGISELYTSPPRAWIVEPKGRGIVDFASRVRKVLFFARMSAEAKSPAVIIVSSRRATIDVHVIRPGEDFRLIEIEGPATRIQVFNPNRDGLVSIDDFSYRARK